MNPTLDQFIRGVAELLRQGETVSADAVNRAFFLIMGIQDDETCLLSVSKAPTAEAELRVTWAQQPRTAWLAVYDDGEGSYLCWRDGDTIELGSIVNPRPLDVANTVTWVQAPGVAIGSPP